VRKGEGDRASTHQRRCGPWGRWRDVPPPGPQNGFRRSLTKLPRGPGPEDHDPRGKLEYTPLGAAFCRPKFTIAELRRVYEIVWEASLDPRNFHRKVTTTPAFVSPTPRHTTRNSGRPAQLYRQGDAAVLYPPLLRPVEERKQG